MRFLILLLSLSRTSTRIRTTHTVDLEANGHVNFADGKKIYGNCNVKISQFSKRLV